MKRSLRSSSLLILVLFFFIANSVSAQEITDKATLSLGGEEGALSSSVLKDFLGSDENYHYLLTRNHSALSILQFNRENELLQSSELNFKNEKLITDRYVVLAGDKLFGFWLTRPKKQLVLFVQEIDKKTLKWKGDLKEIASFSRTSNMQEIVFMFEYLEERKEVLISPYGVVKPTGLRGVMLMDSEMNVSSRVDFDVSHMSENFSTTQAKLGKRGEFYLIGKEFESDEDAKLHSNTGAPSFKYHVIVYSKDGVKTNEFDIDGGEQVVSDLTFSVNDKGELYAIGFFSEDKLGTPTGSIFMRFDTETGTTAKKSFKAFDFELSYNGIGKNWKSSTKDNYKEGQRRDHFVNNSGGIFKLESGAYIYTAQRYYQRAYPDPMSHNYHGDILVVKVNPDEEVERTSRVGKIQDNQPYTFSLHSYRAAIVKDRLFLIYNDHFDNLKSYKEEDPLLCDFQHPMVLMLVEVEADGTIIREPLCNYTDEYRVSVDLILDSEDDGRITVVARNTKKKKDLRMGSIQFN